ncbi:MAG: sigma-70 family RNA polymerase sigma factor [Proteobacteria bacterium]|nr:sigma-70 family RNA polymerase sigma factor [Pseudomonadota bacterium]
MSGQNRDFTRALLESAPSLRAFAISLTGQVEKADDLVQDTLMRAWTHADSFQEGTNIKAWLFTILRNSFASQYRKRKREVEDADGEMAAQLSTPAEQEGHVSLDDLKTALGKLPDEQREAVLLVGASGFSYEEAAEICGCAVGTVKSRVNRARVRLAQLMYGEDWDGAIA